MFLVIVTFSCFDMSLIFYLQVLVLQIRNAYCKNYQASITRHSQSYTSQTTDCF